MEPIIFSCFLKKEGDQKNKIFVTSDKLIIVFKGKIQAFYRSNILKLNLAKKKLIIPLIVGGIVTSLSMLAMSMGWYDRQLNLFVTLLFFGVLYYGFIGKEALEIHEKGNTNVYLLGSNLEYVRKFMQFFGATKSLAQVHSNQKIYHICTVDSWESQVTKTEYKHNSLDEEGFIHASTAIFLTETYKLYYSEGERLVLITILPELLKNELKYELAESRNAHFPHIFGTINKTAIQAAFFFNTEEELKHLISQ